MTRRKTEIPYQMFTDPRGLAAANRGLTKGDRAVAMYGERIWDYMCYWAEGFTTEEIVNALAGECRLTKRTAENYVRAFYAYCHAAADTFSGPASRLERLAGYRWHLTDNPEL